MDTFGQFIKYLSEREVALTFTPKLNDRIEVDVQEGNRRSCCTFDTHMFDDIEDKMLMGVIMGVVAKLPL